VTPILLIVVPLVVVLFALIFRMNHAEHFAPQAYYRRKTVGAPLAYECESLGPRPRKVPPADPSGERLGGVHSDRIVVPPPLSHQ
jgi:hypothetical protein